MDDDSANKSVKILYTTLLQYTKGDAKSKVTSCGMKDAWEAYRYIINKGENITMAAIMRRRMEVINPEPARVPEDIEARLQSWKTDMRILLDSNHPQDVSMVANQDQMVTILISMLPAKVAEQMMVKYDVGSTSLEDIEEKLREYLDKITDSSGGEEMSREEEGR